MTTPAAPTPGSGIPDTAQPLPAQGREELVTPETRGQWDTAQAAEASADVGFASQVAYLGDDWRVHRLGAADLGVDDLAG